MARDSEVKQQDINQAERELTEVRDNLGGSLESLGLEKIERMRRSRARKAAKRRMKGTNKVQAFNNLVDDCIKLFADGQFDQGAEAADELAHIWKMAGQPAYSFVDLMKYIENKAVELTGFEYTRIQIGDALKRRKHGKD